MNELEFKRHLKDLVHGHHHPEEHDWAAVSTKKPAAPMRKTKSTRKKSRKK